MGITQTAVNREPRLVTGYVKSEDLRDPIRSPPGSSLDQKRGPPISPHRLRHPCPTKV
jgi:hypothetical protein